MKRPRILDWLLIDCRALFGALWLDALVPACILIRID
jgi:hypothetical protein